MSWTFTVTNPAGTVVTAVVRNAEFSDVKRRQRKQARGITEGGIIFVQDLSTDVELVEGSWTFLTSTERADLEEFFSINGALFQARAFSIDIAGSSFPQKLKCGMTISAAVVQSGDQKCGAFVEPTTTTLRNVFLDQDELAFTQERDKRFSLDMRFRIENP